MNVRNLLLVLLLCVSRPAFPSGNQFDATTAQVLSHQAQAFSLDRRVTWLDLLQYRKDRFPHSGYTSEVTSKAYFLASNGRYDPLAELQQTIIQNYEPAGADPNQHAQCRFPARHLWLKKNLPGYSGYPEIVCPDFLKWTKNNSVESVSLVFATGYLQNPASYYGHILLKLNYERSVQPSRLLDVTVNYGAIVPAGVDPVSYIVNGVFGGYAGGFSHIQYYFHEHNYGDIELRDLWEYELNLDATRRDMLVAHVWELLGKTYEYYFFDENCAYQMGRLLRSATDIDVLPQHYLWLIPQVIFDRIGDMTLEDGTKLVKSVKYYPSRQVKLYHKYEQLTAEEKKEVTRYVKEPLLPGDPLPQGQDDVSRAKVYETLMEYYDFLKASDRDLYDASIDKQRIALVQRSQLPPDLYNWGDYHSASPDEGSPPARGTLSHVYNTRKGTGYTLDFRPAYYDELDDPVGKVANSRLVMLEVQAQYLDGHYGFGNINLLQVESIKHSVTGLPGDGGNSWNLNLGMKQQDLACSHCLVSYLRGDYGRFFYPGASTYIGVMAGAMEQESYQGSGSNVVIASLRAGMSYAGFFKTGLAYEIRTYLDGNYGTNDVLTIESSYQRSKYWGIRWTYTKDKAEEYSLSYSIYW